MRPLSVRSETETPAIRVNFDTVSMLLLSQHEH